MNNNYKYIDGYNNVYVVYDNGVIESLDRYIEKKYCPHTATVKPTFQSGAQKVLKPKKATDMIQIH